ncbi:M56 family metallopeptidase [Chryseobacterium arthrosphaerae]|uniref:M56 family metallopeptidase n=1 Tax=Chryseobacterium arthrosphaerae TaxID=651561 RepID=UPI0023E1036E|nr:M56 family metallopeptidase [Chryseobacterium arthrosphaerae]WES99216.1 M56 family metallopeptidase [Chryseobacterium arthrosphaerae]
MEAILLYFGKTILCSGVMFLYYQLSLKDKTFHHYNRFYLLAAIVISLLLPLIRIDDFTIEVNSDVYMLLDRIQNFNTDKKLDNGNLYFNIIFSALGLVSFYFLGRLTYGIFKIRQFKKQFQKESFDGINFYRTDLTEAPFSYFKNLFWKNTITLNSEVGKQILKHEMVHIEQKHSFDKIFIEIITAVFWFNPFFHIIKKEINLIHEYLADKKAVKHSDTKAFAQMLLASHFSGTQLPAASPFLSSNLKKRLKMLQKPKTKFGYARRIFALPVLFSVAFAYLVNAKNREIEETNLSIEKAVLKIKKDTVRPEQNAQREKIEAGEPSSPETEAKLAALEKNIKEKETELKGLDPESDAFNKKIDEISSLAAEIGSTVANIEVDKHFNSPEWKKQMKKLENLNPLDKKQLRRIEKEAARAGREAAKIVSKLPVPPAPPIAPEAPDAPKVLYFNDNFVNYKELGPKEKEAVRKAMKEAKKAMQESMKAMKESQKARIESGKIKIDVEKIRKDAEKARIDAQKIAAESMKSLKEIHFSQLGNSPKVIVMNADFIKKDGNGNISMDGVKKFNISSGDDFMYKYYIDGKEVSKDDVNRLNPSEIARVMVNNQKTGDLKKGEVKVETKK